MTNTIEELKQRAQEVKQKYREYIFPPPTTRLIEDQQAKIEELWAMFREVDAQKQDLAFKYNDLLLRTLKMEKEQGHD